jgi:hypothetical protein
MLSTKEPAKEMKPVKARVLCSIILAGSGCIRMHTNAIPTAPPLTSVPNGKGERGSPEAQVRAQPVSTAQSRSTGGGNKATTLTGCLGSMNGPMPYALTDEQGMRFAVGGTKDLDNHVGHKVKLTGSVAGTAFTATKVEDLSQSCMSAF